MTRGWRRFWMIWGAVGLVFGIIGHAPVGAFLNGMILAGFVWFELAVRAAVKRAQNRDRGGSAVTVSRGTTNKNQTGNSKDRARRRARLVARFGWPDAHIVCCYRCGVPLLQDDDPEAPGQSVTVDRIVPGCLGGTYEDDNTRPACGPCNEETGGYLGVAQRTGKATA